MAGIAIKFAQKRADIVAEVVGQLQADCEAAQFAWNVQQLVAEMATMAEPVWRATEPFRDGLRPDTDPQKLATAQAVAGLLNFVLSLFPQARNLIQDVRRVGHTVDGVNAFENAEAEIALIRKDFCSRWPMPDAARVKKAKEQVAAGQSRVL